VPLLGVISDTHDLLRPEALAALEGCQLIVHAGDICAPSVLEGLAAVAPVRAVRGNNDRGAWAAALPEEDLIELAGSRIHVVHEDARRSPGVQAELLISGHSHRPRQEEREGLLYLNPGSAGPRRFRLPVSLALVELDAGRLTVRHVDLPLT
jgi:putative phosphoesterase